MALEKDETRLRELCEGFRRAIELARDDGSFDGDPRFSRFPRGCCGPTSDLLGQYLECQGIATWRIDGTFYSDWIDPDFDSRHKQTHSWLTNVDPRVDPDYLILDITGDQFKHDEGFLCYDIPSYVGGMDEFHLIIRMLSGRCTQQ